MQAIMVIFFNEKKNPVHDDEFNFYESLQTHLIELASIKEDNYNLPIAHISPR